MKLKLKRWALVWTNEKKVQRFVPNVGNGWSVRLFLTRNEAREFKGEYKGLHNKKLKLKAVKVEVTVREL